MPRRLNSMVERDEEAHGIGAVLALSVIVCPTPGSGTPASDLLTREDVDVLAQLAPDAHRPC